MVTEYEGPRLLDLAERTCAGVFFISRREHHVRSTLLIKKNCRTIVDSQPERNLIFKQPNRTTEQLDCHPIGRSPTPMRSIVH